MAPITLTRQQFLQKRPGGSYQNYIRFVTNARARRAAARTANPYQSLISTASIPTPAQQSASARAQVDAAIKGAVASARSSVQPEIDQYGNQATRAQGFALALGNLLKPSAENVLGQYRDAGSRLAAYGTGLTGAVADAQTAANAAANERVRSLMGDAPAVAGYDPQAIRNAATMAGLVLPGSELEQRALDAAARATYAGNAAATNAGSIAQGFLQKQSDLENQIAAKIADIQGQRPDLYQKALTAAQDAARQDKATLISALSLGNTIRGTTADIKATNKKIKAAAAAGKNPDSTLSKTYGYIVDSSGRAILDANGHRQPVAGYKRLANGKIVKDPKAAKGATAHLQQKTLDDGTVVNFNPLTGQSTDPKTGKVIDPNAHGKAKIAPDKLRTYRATATNDIAATVKAHPDARPAELYRLLVAKGVPGWIVATALRAEAVNHPDDVAWQNVLKPGWVAGA